MFVSEGLTCEINTIRMAWTKPQQDWYNLNANGSYLYQLQEGGADFLDRDSNGVFIFAGCKIL